VASGPTFFLTVSPALRLLKLLGLDIAASVDRKGEPDQVMDHLTGGRGHPVQQNVCDGPTGIDQAERMRIRRDPRFRRWTHDYKAGRRWPLTGFVAVIGAEAQDAVFLPSRLVEQLGTSAVQLRAVGEQRWLAGPVGAEALLQELIDLLETADLSDEDRLVVDHAVELVEYEIGNRTGVAVAPPTD
jgi:hypothetical protein